MTREQKILATEYTAVALLWIVAFTLPLLVTREAERNWRSIYLMWTEFSLIGVVFIINRFILMPKLFFKQRYAQYAMAISCIFIVVALLILYFDIVDSLLSLWNKGELAQTIEAASRPQGIQPHGMPPHIAPPHNLPPAEKAMNVIPPSLNILILMAIITALDTGITTAVQWIISEHRQMEMKKEGVSAQLTNLQNQVSPHFFMNTLNNIHALVEIDPQRAQKTIIELSGLMDYLLYECSSQERVQLKREIEFTRSYIDLMRLRYPKRVAIEFNYDSEIPNFEIPPLLFLNFIENTFKYGVNYSKSSFIDIRFLFHSSYIEMTAKNSNHSRTIKSIKHGLGIDNSKKRLELLYGDRYSLKISDMEDIYCVKLKIPIQ